jgi:transforming growth factor-beta-induced protein
MKTCLIASVFCGAIAWLDNVPAGKAVIETREYNGVQQCAGDKIRSTFEVDQDKCLALAGTSSSINTDQVVHCRDDKYFELTTYKSFDGSCTGEITRSLHRKDQCLLNSDSGLAGVFVRCPGAHKSQNIVELAESVESLSTLVSAVVAGNLVDTLSSPGPFTVFAPTNDGFAALPAGTLDSLMKPENKAELVDILTYHVLGSEVKSTDLKAFQRVQTVEGKGLQVFKNGGKVTVGPSSKDLKNVVAADNLASNGVVHIIDGVLLPPQGTLLSKKPNIVELAESVKDLSTLVSAVVAGDLVDTLSSPGPFTVFAPTNEGFAALPASTLDNLMKPENKAQLVDILTYHVLPVQAFSKDLALFQATTTVEGKALHIAKWGDGVKVGPSLKSEDLKTVTSADNAASNGVVHIIDGVLLPPSGMPNIVELAESVKDLSTLVSAVVAGDLVDTLSSPGPFTVFAPTNAGFAALSAGTLDNLLKPENKAQLVDILTYHVLPVQAFSQDLALFQATPTVEGKLLHVAKWGGNVKVGPSLKSEDLRTVTSADNVASNGVVHIIDGVLLPSQSAIVV